MLVNLSEDLIARLKRNLIENTPLYTEFDEAVEAGGLQGWNRIDEGDVAPTPAPNRRKSRPLPELIEEYEQQMKIIREAQAKKGYGLPFLSI